MHFFVFKIVSDRQFSNVIRVHSRHRNMRVEADFGHYFAT